MTYELVKELNDASFPVKPDGQIHLEDLIEACGERFWMLEARDLKQGNWNASGYFKEGIQNTYGISPQEAVARLWLALNPKEE